jgi:transposase-like protein
LRSGKPLFGKDGAFAPLLKEFLEAAMEGELDEHLDDAQRENGNRKNGRT